MLSVSCHFIIIIFNIIIIRKVYVEFIQNVSAGEVSLSRDVLFQRRAIFSAGEKNPVVHVHEVPVLRTDSDQYRLSCVTGGDGSSSSTVMRLHCSTMMHLSRILRC